MKNNEARNLVGCCGIYCGLCSKYQSKAPSRCVGCKLGEQHSWCSIWNCCVKKHGFETCTECGEVFRCELFLRRKVAEWIPAADNKSNQRSWFGKVVRRTKGKTSIVGIFTPEL